MCCNWEERLTRGEIARQIVIMILLAVVKGYLLPRKAKDIKKAIYYGLGHYLLDSSGWIVIAYAETMEFATCFVLRSVVVAEEFRGNGLCGKVVTKAIDAAQKIDSEKPIMLACHRDLVGVYTSLGFVKQDKALAPNEVRGGRMDADWLSSDREWMLYVYDRERSI